MLHLSCFEERKADPTFSLIQRWGGDVCGDKIIVLRLLGSESDSLGSRLKKDQQQVVKDVVFKNLMSTFKVPPVAQIML